MVIYAIFKFAFDSFRRYHASLAADSKERKKGRKSERRKKERSQRIDDLPILMTHWSGTSGMLSSKVNGRSCCSWKHSVMPNMAHTGL